ncbi:MAG TPA: hypothetical protein VK967_02285 [Methylotenera sp.]|nr:hypothetical protein [Methylotenera sp.]
MFKRFILPLMFGMLLLSGCATQGQQTQQIDRISEEELARIMPKPVAALSLEDIVKLTKEGATADQIIEKIKASGSTYDLTPSQSVMLSKQGVDSKVLDYIHESRELAVKNSIADEINKREKAKRVELERLKRQQRQYQYYYDPFCFYPYGFYPYGAYYGRHYGFGARFGHSWGCW